MRAHEILAVFTEILGDLLQDDRVMLTMETRREEIPNWDSFNYINFIVAIEVKFRIKFTIAAVESFADVGAVVKETMRLLSANG
jgi:acyl carrier protein